MAKIPEPFSMTKITGPILGGLAIVGAFNDIPLVHYVWLSASFALSKVVLIWLANDGVLP